jgi:hypothetical protein
MHVRFLAVRGVHDDAHGKCEASSAIDRSHVDRIRRPNPPLRRAAIPSAGPRAGAQCVVRQAEIGDEIGRARAARLRKIQRCGGFAGYSQVIFLRVVMSDNKILVRRDVVRTKHSVPLVGVPPGSVGGALYVYGITSFRPIRRCGADARKGPSPPDPAWHPHFWACCKYANVVESVPSVECACLFGGAAVGTLRNKYEAAKAAADSTSRRTQRSGDHKAEFLRAAFRCAHAPLLRVRNTEVGSETLKSNWGYV